MRPHAILLMLALCVMMPLSARGKVVADMGAAREYCDSAPLRGVEGIWEYPDDETRVLIRKAARGDFDFDIILISSPDCRLVPGEIIGTLRQQPDPVKYEMSIFREKRHGILVNPGNCAATLDSSKGALFVEASRLKFSVGTLWFLPRFWRTVRIGFSNPREKLRKGLVRIYPETAGREKRYL